jgi:uncharacterized membrane protein
MEELPRRWLREVRVREISIIQTPVLRAGVRVE